MIDYRLQRMAQTLVRYSLNIQEGDHLAIRSGPAATPLLHALVREALHAGAYPEVFVQLPGVQEIILKEGSEAQIASPPSDWQLAVNEFDAILDIQAQENTRSLSTIAPERQAIQNRSRGGIMRTLIQRSIQGNLHWTLTLFPTNAYAQDTNVSLSDFEDMFYRACFLDDDNPIARWRELSQQQERFIEWLKGKKIVHIQGKETDLTFSIEGRLFLNEDGHYNFPGGEFFTGPVENSVNGSILYNVASTFGGQSVDQVRLYFEQGRVVEAKAAQGQAYLEKMLRLDDGACRLGEFAFGNNSNVHQCTQNVLFDEKMGGTIHLALGASIPATRGINQSALHWDMVYDLRLGSEIRIDGELFCKDGVFVV